LGYGENIRWNVQERKSPTLAVHVGATHVDDDVDEICFVSK